MTILAAVAAVLLLLAPGWLLFRALMRRLCPATLIPSDSELLLIGILPAFALAGTIATYLAFSHLLRPWVLSALLVGIPLWLKNDSLALGRALKNAGLDILGATRRGNLFPVIAVAVSLGFLATGLLLSQIPAETVDVWAFHLPLAHGFIQQEGYAPLLANSLFYSNQPLLFELLYALAMFVVDHYLAADAINVAIFFGLMMLVASFPTRLRAAQVLLIFFFLFWLEAFTLDAAEPMIDLPRACFSVGAFLFAYRYVLNFRRHDLILSALLAGAAVAGKYTELMTPGLIGIGLLPFIIRRGTWRDILPAAIAFIAVAAPWYVKNAISFGNPLYPFVFGHPGLSDEWMAGYMRDIGRPFHIADRAYSTDLMTLRGWGDFAVVVVRSFAAVIPAAAIGLAGLFLPRPHRWLLPAWSAVLLIVWYAIMFNSTRWAMTALLLITANGLLTLFWTCDRLAEGWRPALIQNIGIEQWIKRVPNKPGQRMVVSSKAAALFLALGVLLMAAGQRSFLIPRWMSRDLASALVSPQRMDQWLAATRPGYTMYHYIGEHNLAHVLQPFDNGALYYASAYNGGQPNNWVLASNVLPVNPADTKDFLHWSDVHYFILPAQISALDRERLTPAHVAHAEDVLAILRPHGKLIYKDNNGWSLYRIEGWP